MNGLSVKKAIQLIEASGALLVFPIDNRRQPESLWYRFFPKSEMRWEWDADGDHRVADLWHLKTELSTTGRVVYSKWYRGRATYFSKPLFVALLRSLNPHLDDRLRNQATLSTASKTILECLQAESPLSTKELKRLADMKGRDREREYEKALKELWSRCLIVAYGEVDDGAFPSLAIGSTEALFEDLWQKALDLGSEKAENHLKNILNADEKGKNLFYQFFLKLRKSAAVIPQATPASPGSASKKTRRTKSSVIDFKDL